MPAKAKGKKVAKSGKAKGKKVAKSTKAKSTGKTKPEIVISNELELPNVRYNFTMKTMLKIFNKIRRECGTDTDSVKYDDSDDIITACRLPIFDGMKVTLTPSQVIDRFYTGDYIPLIPEYPDLVASILTVLREYEDQSVIQPIEPLDDDASPSGEHQTSQDFDELHLKALFWLYDEDRYAYLRIKIAPSAIKAAGMGAYAVDDIPKSAIGLYTGVPRFEDDANLYYSWVVKSFDPQEGIEDDNETYMYYIDATDLKRSNWTRYVNCGMKDKDNNMEQEQVYDKIFYTTTKKVPAGKEFFIDYGPEYREYNLGMKGKY